MIIYQFLRGKADGGPIGFHGHIGHEFHHDGFVGGVFTDFGDGGQGILRDDFTARDRGDLRKKVGSFRPVLILKREFLGREKIGHGLISPLLSGPGR